MRMSGSVRFLLGVLWCFSNLLFTHGQIPPNTSLSPPGDAGSGAQEEGGFMESDLWHVRLLRFVSFRSWSRTLTFVCVRFAKVKRGLYVVSISPGFPGDYPPSTLSSQQTFADIHLDQVLLLGSAIGDKYADASLSCM